MLHLRFKDRGRDLWMVVLQQRQPSPPPALLQCRLTGKKRDAKLIFLPFHCASA